jgi:hypothetical protein
LFTKQFVLSMVLISPPPTHFVLYRPSAPKEHDDLGFPRCIPQSGEAYK